MDTVVGHSRLGLGLSSVHTGNLHIAYYRNSTSMVEMVFQIYPLFLKLEPDCPGCEFSYISCLWFPAPYTPVKKSIMKTGQDEVELSCASQGFPSAQVIWSDGQNTNLTEMSNSTTRSTDEDLIHIISKLTVKRDLVNNYSCSFLVKGEIQQMATFSIPGESH